MPVFLLFCFYSRRKLVISSNFTVRLDWEPPNNPLHLDFFNFSNLNQFHNQNLRQIGQGVSELWSDKQTEITTLYNIVTFLHGQKK